MQGFIVTLIVLAAAMYAVWYWMPGSWRRALASRLAGRSERLAQAVGQAPGCGACKTCSSCDTKVAMPVSRKPGDGPGLS